jgi:predicted N-acetyltransferase YhbS
MIREATNNDILSIRLLMKLEPGFWQNEWRDNVVEIAIVSSNGLSFVWEEGDHIEGFICAHDVGFRAYLSALVVTEGARSKGIGRKLLKCVEKKLAQKGCSLIIADAWRNSVDFYQHLGWSPPEATLLRKKLKV